MTANEQAAVACILTCLAGLCVGAAWVWWVRPLRLVPAPPVLSDAEWAAVLAAVSPPLDWSTEEWAAREREVTS